MIQPDDLRKMASANETGHGRFLATLKQKPPRDLDQRMNELHNEVFSKTNCLECGNCCRIAGPLFTQRDVATLSGHLKLRPGEFVQRYLRVDEDGDHVFKSTPCPFLGDDNYCSVYDHRPKACREYPHTNRKKFYQINDLTLKNVAICPAAYEIVEKLKLSMEK